MVELSRIEETKRKEADGLSMQNPTFSLFNRIDGCPPEDLMYDCLAKHLHHIVIFNNTLCILYNHNSEMNKDHLLSNPSMNKGNI